MIQTPGLKLKLRWKNSVDFLVVDFLVVDFLVVDHICEYLFFNKMKELSAADSQILTSATI